MRESTVALVKGDHRYDNVRRALESIADEVQLEGKRRVLIKPNFVSTQRQLAATHVEAVRALLDFLREHYHGTIIIGEGAATSDTWEGYENFGYLSLAEEYDVQLMDLNRDEWVEVEVYDRRLRPMTLRLARTVVESDYRISITPPKCHDTVVVTLNLKNLIMGSLIRDPAGQRGAQVLNALDRLTPGFLKESTLAERMKAGVVSGVARSDKFAMHQGYPVINLNLYTLARLIPPHLSVIDGFQGMEGAGPVNGDPVDLRLAIASTDFLAADSLAARIMGFDLEEVGYLYYCHRTGLGTGDLAGMQVVGNVSVDECVTAFRPHPTYRQQLQWRSPKVQSFIEEILNTGADK